MTQSTDELSFGAAVGTGYSGRSNGDRSDCAASGSDSDGLLLDEVSVSKSTLSKIRANHVSSSQSDRSKRVTCRCIKSLNAHFASLNAHFVEHKNAKAT